MARKRSLVLGGAGFVGSHLCDRLIERGDEVIAMDNLYTGSLDNIAHLRRHPRFSFVEHDVVERFHIPADVIFNLACPASRWHYQADPVKTTLTSVLGTVHSLELGRRCRAKVFLASTGDVYGDPEVHPQLESYHGCVSTIGPRACHDEGKRCAESLMMDYARKYGVDVRIARIFDTYGPRMDPHDGRVVSSFVVQALEGRPLTIYGDGSQTRTFCYVDDVVDGILRLVDHEDFTGPVNLGSSTELTVRQLAEIVCALVHGDVDVLFEPLPEDDAKMRRPVLDVAREVLGFRPMVPLHEGLARTIAYFAERGAVPERRRTPISLVVPRPSNDMPDVEEVCS